MNPIERPCVPPALQLEAEQAERRKDEALDRLLQTVGGKGPMKTSNQGLTILIEREAARNHAYLDSEGIPTIGIGHTGPEVRLGLTWTDEQIRETFAKDIERFEKSVNDSVHVPLDPHQFDALVSFAFNVGEMGVMNSWVVREINAARWDAAAAAFDNWHKPPSVITRRNGEREQFRGTKFAARLDDSGNPA